MPLAGGVTWPVLALLAAAAGGAWAAHDAVEDIVEERAEAIEKRVDQTAAAVDKRAAAIEARVEQTREDVSGLRTDVGKILVLMEAERVPRLIGRAARAGPRP